MTTSAIYLALGVVIGPVGWGWLTLELGETTQWLERITEVAVVISLFVGGLKLRLAVRNPAWVPVLRLAGPVMLLSIAGVAAFAIFAFDFGVAEALLLGAVLAPTDPVLASSVSVQHATDDDRVHTGFLARPVSMTVWPFRSWCLLSSGHAKAVLAHG